MAPISLDRVARFAVCGRLGLETCERVDMDFARLSEGVRGDGRNRARRKVMREERKTAA